MAAIAISAAVAGCSANQLIGRLALAPSPHERYASSLRDANLGETALGRDWLLAGERALAQPLSVILPLNETGYFPADAPAAVAYRLELQRGRRLEVDLSFDGLEFPQLFIDLFEVRQDAAPRRVASLTEGRVLAFDVPRDGTYLLRVQPELLRSGRFTVIQRTLASLPFPVSGLTAAAVQSEFGAARDAGRRLHEGIDIFAPRQTPVLAVVDGVARTGTNALGGQVIWLRGNRFNASFYYAHLERWAFEGAARVRAGDVLGYVGNSGNARATSPHLHFGIYDGGAIDPFPYIRADDPRPAAADAVALNELVRFITRATLRSGTPPTAAVLARLDRGVLARATGVMTAQLRIELPDRRAGYVDRAAVTLARKPLRQQQMPAGTAIREHPLPEAPAVVTTTEGSRADVLGEFNGFAFIRGTGLPSGWVASAQ